MRRVPYWPAPLTPSGELHTGGTLPKMSSGSVAFVCRTLFAVDHHQKSRIAHDARVCLCVCLSPRTTHKTHRHRRQRHLHDTCHFHHRVCRLKHRVVPALHVERWALKATRLLDASPATMCCIFRKHSLPFLSREWAAIRERERTLGCIKRKTLGCIKIPRSDTSVV